LKEGSTDIEDKLAVFFLRRILS